MSRTLSAQSWKIDRRQSVAVRAAKKEPGPRPASTLLAVARAAGVDQSTASRVLRSDPAVRVRPDTRERIKAAADELGYVPSAIARSLVLRKTMTLGLIIPSTANIVYAEIIKGAESAARANGYVLLLTESSDVGKADSAYRELVLGGRVDGLLIGSGTMRDSFPGKLVHPGGRCLVLNRQIKGPMPSVIEDDERGMALGVEKLVSLGHTRIACHAGPADVDTARRRLAGFTEGMRAAGLPVPRGYVPRTDFDEAGGFEATRRLLRLRNPPTAIVESSLVSAAGALAACHGEGFRVPDDISLIAFHDAKIADYLIPALTTIWMPLFELGKSATELLIDLIHGREVPALQRVQNPAPRIIERKSTAPPAAP
jgi:LacI family transcriptional regulator